MKAIVFGGATGIGRSIARVLAARGDSVLLMGLDTDELVKSAADLRARAPSTSKIAHAICDLEKTESFEAALDAADVALGNFDTVIVTAAMFATAEALDADVELTRRLVTVNYANTVTFCEHVRHRLLARGGGRLTVFSSVAGDRGRKPVGVYGSSKAGIAIYLEALDHKYYASGLSVLCVKPGFVKTGMTAGLKPPPFASDPDTVAKDVVRAMDRGKALLYTPRIWALVMWVIRMLPRFVMRKIGF